MVIAFPSLGASQDGIQRRGLLKRLDFLSGMLLGALRTVAPPTLLTKLAPWILVLNLCFAWHQQNGKIHTS